MTTQFHKRDFWGPISLVNGMKMQRRPVIIAEFQNITVSSELFLCAPVPSQWGGGGLGKRRNKASIYWANHIESSFPLLSDPSSLPMTPWKKGRSYPPGNVSRKLWAVLSQLICVSTRMANLWYLTGLECPVPTHFQRFLPLASFSLKELLC